MNTCKARVSTYTSLRSKSTSRKTITIPNICVGKYQGWVCVGEIYVGWTSLVIICLLNWQKRLAHQCDCAVHLLSNMNQALDRIYFIVALVTNLVWSITISFSWRQSNGIRTSWIYRDKIDIRYRAGRKSSKTITLQNYTALYRTFVSICICNPIINIIYLGVNICGDIIIDLFTQRTYC